MAVHHLILSLMRDGPSYGYELKTAFERTVGPQWGAVNIGHVYQLLQRLERDGLITAAGSADPSRGPERQLYASTPEGAAELRRWLRSPARPPAGYRTELFLKLAAAVRGDPDDLDGLLAAERRVALDELRALKSQQGEESDPLILTLIDGAVAHLEAQLAFLRSARARRDELVRAHGGRAAVADVAQGTAPAPSGSQASTGPGAQPADRADRRREASGPR